MIHAAIRDANINDLDNLLRFEQNLINEERPFDQTIRSSSTVYYDLKGMLSNADVKLVVAERSDEIIGTGYAQIKNAEAFSIYTKYAFLGFMYVVPAYRGKGINRKIIQRLQGWVLSKNINEIRLDVYCGNNAAIKAYTKAGFVNHVLEMRLTL